MSTAGPGKGIGKAIAVRFAEEGAKLVLAGRKADVLEEVRVQPAFVTQSKALCTRSSKARFWQ